MTDTETEPIKVRRVNMGKALASIRSLNNPEYLMDSHNALAARLGFSVIDIEEARRRVVLINGAVDHINNRGSETT